MGVDPFEEYLRYHDSELCGKYKQMLPSAHRDTARRLTATLTLENLQPDGTDAWKTLLDDAADSARNLAVARASVKHRQRTTQGLTASAHNLALESLCTDGHNLHPLSRTRRDFTLRETLAYTSECGGRVSLQLVACRRDLLTHTPDESGHTVDELLRKSANLDDSHAHLAEAGLDPEQYTLLPVHPWQRLHALSHSYGPELAHRTLIDLPDTIDALPSTSLRTLLVNARGTHPALFVKTSLAARITTARRNISPATCQQGPPLSLLLSHLIAADPALSEKVRVLRDLASVHFASPHSDHGLAPVAERERNLSVIIRESIDSYVGPEEIPVTGVSLYSFNPATQRPILVDLLEESDLPLPQAGHQLWEDYLDSFVTLFLRMFSLYGLGIEAHLQNLVLIFRRGRLVRLLLRDFGGMRIHTERFTTTDVAFTPHPDNVTMRSDIRDVYAATAHACVHANLAEVARVLAHWCNVTYPWCSKQFSRKVHAVAEALRRIRDSRQQVVRNRVDEDAAAFTAPLLPRKAFLKPRLHKAIPEDARNTDFFLAPHPFGL